MLNAARRRDNVEGGQFDQCAHRARSGDETEFRLSLLLESTEERRVTRGLFSALGWVLCRQHNRMQAIGAADAVCGHFFDIAHGQDGRRLLRSSRSVLSEPSGLPGSEFHCS